MITIYIKKPHGDSDSNKQIQFLREQDRESKILVFLWDDVELDGSLFVEVHLC
jgi:hypothetical protein